MNRRIALVSYFYPPDHSVGSHRWPPLVHYLRERGHDVTVITTSAFGALRDDRPWVVRTRDLQASPVLRRVLRRRSAINAAGRPTVVVQPAPKLLADGPVPDAHLISWLPFVVPTLRRVVRERAIDCIVTNGPPDSTHLAVLGLRGSRPAWIADFEDGWRFEPQRAAPWPTRAQDRLDGALEARVVRGAQVLVGLSSPIADDFRRRYGVSAHSIGNAWDPRLEDAVRGGVPPAAEPGTVSIVHTGNLSHGSRRDPAGLLAALEHLATEDPQIAKRVRLVLAGRLTEGDTRLLSGLSPGAAAMVRHVGELDRADAVALQRRADALLLLSTGDQRSVVTGKIFEYLASARPILALSDENEATRIVRETCTGIVASPHDPIAIADVLRNVATGASLAGFAPRNLEPYVHPGPALAFEVAIEAAVATREAVRARSPRARRSSRRG